MAIIEETGYCQVCIRRVSELLRWTKRDNVASEIGTIEEVRGYLQQMATKFRPWVRHSYQNPSGNRWNGATRHPQGRRHLVMRRQHGKSGLQFFWGEEG
jgi:predicted Fe-S protein YdhL (DUF1289 family)